MINDGILAVEEDSFKQTPARRRKASEGLLWTTHLTVFDYITPVMDVINLSFYILGEAL